MSCAVSATPKSGYASVNGLNMYYEIKGTGDPLVYIPPAFGFAGLRSFTGLVQNRSILSIDLQGYGRTADIPDRPLSLEQHARDVVGLLGHLGIEKADFYGESYGGGIATLLALRHPDMVRRVVTYGATFGPGKDAHNLEMLHFDSPPTHQSDAFRFQRESYRKVAPDPSYWPNIWEKVLNIHWEGFSKEELASVTVPLLMVVGDHDFVSIEHALETFKLVPNSELAVIPDASHFAPFSEQEKLLPVIKHFLDKPSQRLPLATAGMGYDPAQTR